MSKSEYALLATIFRQAAAAADPIQSRAAAIQSLPPELGNMVISGPFSGPEIEGGKICSQVLYAIAHAYQRAADEVAAQ